MSGIYIKGMEMPKNCCQCPVNMELCKRGYKYLLEHPELYDERADDCPLIPVPDHGRLIDADALTETIIEQESNDYNIKHTPRSWARAFCAFEDITLDAPTIIPGEEVDNG